MPLERRQGDVAGLWLMGAGVAIYITELWRDPEGRGSFFDGAIDGPQIAAVLLVLAGALVLRERKRASRATPDTISDHAAADPLKAGNPHERPAAPSMCPPRRDGQRLDSFSSRSSRA